MSTFLYRIGRAVFDRPWFSVGSWAVLGAAIVAILVSSPPSLSSEVRIDGTPAQQVIDSLDNRMPEASGGQGLVAFVAPPGTRIDSAENMPALLAAVDGIYNQEHVVDAREVLAAEAAKGADSALLRAVGAVAVASATLPANPDAPLPLLVDGFPVPGVNVAPDGSVATFTFVFDQQTFELPDGTVAAAIDAAEVSAHPAGIQVLPAASMVQIPELVGASEVVGLLFAGLVLIVTLGTIVAAGLPLVSALTGVVVGVGGAFTLSQVFEIHSLAAVLALMLGLAVGIDYSLFVVNKQRTFILRDGLTAREAAARAVGTAGNAVVFAGSTVVIALLGLIVVRIALLSTMAAVAAATIAVAVLSALTLLPALLGLFGERIVTRRIRARYSAHADADRHHPFSDAWGRFVTRHRYLAVAGALVVTGALAIPMLGMQTGLPSGASYNTDSAQRSGYDAITAGFGEGHNGPLVVVATAPEGLPIAPEGLAGLYVALTTQPGVQHASLAGVSADGGTALFAVVPTGGPNDQETADLVANLRGESSAYSSAYGASIGVTGFSALAIDISVRLREALPLYVGIVLLLSLVVLTLVFRSVVVPIKATVGFALSLAATLGATTAVFQWGWLQGLLALDATAPVLSFLPIILTGVLYGLAMDYQLFLVSSMREAHVHGSRGHASVTQGLRTSGRVVVAAALVMISVFAGFAFNSDPMIKQAGFALAFGILVDAFIVRLTLVPALLALFGERAWRIPSWLDRILPNLDIEGDVLARALGSRRDDAVAKEAAPHAR